MVPSLLPEASALPLGLNATLVNAASAARLHNHGIVRLLQEIWTVPGRVKLAGASVQRIRLRREHPRARRVL
jgi:hypothetical protein